MRAFRYLRHLMGGLRFAFREPQVQALVLLAGSLIGVATVFYRLVEGWSIIDSLYFSVVTIATVGYGDLAPHTVLGKLFTIVYIFAGIGLFVAAATAIAQAVIYGRPPRE